MQRQQLLAKQKEVRLLKKNTKKNRLLSRSLALSLRSLALLSYSPRLLPCQQTKKKRLRCMTTYTHPFANTHTRHARMHVCTRHTHIPSLSRARSLSPLRPPSPTHRRCKTNAKRCLDPEEEEEEEEGEGRFRYQTRECLGCLTRKCLLLSLNLGGGCRVAEVVQWGGWE